MKKRRTSERAWSLSSHLLALCLAILVPGIVLGSAALWSLFSAERTSTELRLLQAVEHIADGIDREVQSATRVGESLAASPLLRSGEYEAFDLQARQLLGLQGWYVILTNRDGRQIINTTLPAGSALPKADPERIREVIETGKPRISDLFDTAGKLPLVGVRLPVISGGETAYVLTIAVPVEIFTPLLDQSIGKLSWTVEVADRSGRIIARSHKHADYVGRRLSEDALEQLNWGMPIRRGISAEGEDAMRVVHRSPLAGWIVAATMPSAELAAISRQGWTTFALLAAALAALSIFLAYVFARRIAQPVHQLASIPLEGRTDGFPETGLAEANQVGAALIESIRELEASEERYRTLVEAANDIIYTTDLDGRFLTCNAAGYKALGLTDGELIGRPLSSLVSGGQPCSLEDLLSNADRQGQRRCEVEVTARSGRILIWEISSRLLRDARGIPETILSIARDVTERKRAEEAIRANEERLRLALAGVGAGVWEYDFTARQRTWSPEMMELYGLTDRAEPPTREEMLNFVHPDDRERVRISSERQIKYGGPFSVNFRVVRPDGRLVWISSKGLVERDADGRAIRARGIDQDVTAARNAEAQREQLLQTTAQQLNELQSLYDSAPVGLALLDREFRFQRINSVLAEMTGLPVESHLGKTASDLVPAFRSTIEPHFQRVLETGEPVTGIEFSGETPAQPGAPRTWISQLYPLKSPDGSVVGIGLIFDEVTEQRRAQLEQAHLAAIVESSTDAIVSWSTDGRIRSWNPGAEQMFGYTAAEAIGRGLDLLVPPCSGEPRSEIFERVKAGERVTVESVRRRKDGTDVPVSISASPMRDGFGRIVAVSVIFRDISEQKRREEHTRFIMRELSHRSKNLLAVLQAMARQTSRTSRDLSDFQERFTSRVRGLAQSHDLLVKRDWRGVPVSELVRAHLLPFVDRSEHEMILSGPTLSLKPEAAQNIGLALHELATNASKHGALSGPAGGRIEIRWGLDERGGATRFHMLWREAGGPPVVVPSQAGFGHTVVEAMIGRALEGEAHIDWNENGLVWRLDAPATCVALEGAPFSTVELLPEGMASELQAHFRKWLALSSRSGALPPPSTIDLDALPDADRVFLVAIDPATEPARIRYLYVGKRLAQLFGRPDEGEPLKPGGRKVLGSGDGYYECTMQARRPCYEWVRMRFDESPLELERLLLPFSENGETVSSLLGVTAINAGT